MGRAERAKARAAAKAETQRQRTERTRSRQAARTERLKAGGGFAAGVKALGDVAVNGINAFTAGGASASPEELAAGGPNPAGPGAPESSTSTATYAAAGAGLIGLLYFLTR